MRIINALLVFSLEQSVIVAKSNPRDLNDVHQTTGNNYYKNSISHVVIHCIGQPEKLFG